MTAQIPLLGAEGYHAFKNQVDRLASRQRLPAWRVTNLLDRYGSMVTDLFELCEADPSLLEPLAGAEEYLRVELLYGVTHEGALHLDDLLARRIRISIETPDRGTTAATAVAELVGPLLGWDDDRTRNEIAAYSSRVAAERESQQELDDQEANAERLAAPDIRARAVGRALD